MSKSRVFELLPLFKGKRKKDLIVFAQMSSNHLSPREEIILAQLLEAYDPNKDFAEHHFTKQHLNPSEQANWNKIKNHFNKVIRKYLLMEIVQESPIGQEMLLTAFYGEQEMDKNYAAGINKIKTELGKKSRVDEKYSLYQYFLYEVEARKQKDIRKEDDKLYQMNQMLDDFYLENKLRLVCEIQNRQVILNSSRQIPRVDELLKDLVAEEQNISIQVYLHIYQLQQTNEAARFHALRHLLRVHEEAFTPAYLKSIYTYLLNYCVRKINYGDIDYALYFLEIIDRQIDNQIFLEGQQINPNQYKNCITISLLANNPAWGSDFLQQFKNNIPKADRQMAVQFNQAQIHFFQKEFEECHRALIGFQTKDMYYMIAYKKLVLKLFYYQFKSGDFTRKNLRAVVESTKKYIANQKGLNAARKEKVFAFLRCFLRLVDGESVEVRTQAGNLPVVDYYWLEAEGA